MNRTETNGTPTNSASPPGAAAHGFALADGGIETALTDRLGQELPEFAAFVLLDTADGREALREYYRPFLALAARRGMPLVLDTPTWRANPDWGSVLGRDAAALERANADAVALLRTLVEQTAPDSDVTVNGCVGPRFDDFVAADRMSVESARDYHAPQIAALAEAGADRVTSVTTLDVAEGSGIVLAAREARIPAAVSFTVGADGRLADGSTLASAIAAVDAATGGAAVGFLVNCAHPSEVRRGLEAVGGGSDRIIGFRLNAARYGEEGPGDTPEEFAAGIAGLLALAPNARVLGGCCGTDAPHIAAVADAVAVRAA